MRTRRPVSGRDALGAAAGVLLPGLVLLAASGVAAAPDPGPAAGATCSAAPDTAGAGVSMRMLGEEPMEATRHAPGGDGTLGLSFGPSPYGLAVTADGRPRYRIAVETRGLRVSGGRRPTVWAATPELDEVRRLGPLGEDGSLRGVELEWSRFMVFVTAEPGGSEGARWEGPILLVGRAPSSRMHTMRGHGIFEAHGIGC